MANKYANQIYEAIDILTDQKLRNLKLDCTVQAIVKDNTNASKGYYTIEIQDANQNQQIIARSNRIDYVYPLNSCVYVTIPQNNSALDKWILGSVEVETSELDAYYYEEERPVQSGAEGTFDGVLALAQLIGGGDMLIIDFKVKDNETSGDGDGKLSFKGALKVGNTELVPVELNEDNIEGDPYFVDDTQRFTYKIPAHEYEITDTVDFKIDEESDPVDIEIDKIYIGKSDNEPFMKLLTAKLLDTANPPAPKEKIVFNFAADAVTQKLQLQAYYNGVAIENNVTYSWAFDDATMNHVITSGATAKEATFSRNELWRDGTFNFTAAITYDGERVPVTSSVSSINFPVVSISQSTAGEVTTLTANLMVGSEIKENPWGSRTELTYLWNDGSTNKSITRPKLKAGDSQNYTCTVKQQGIEIGSGNTVVIPQPEAAAQGVIAITNGNALLVWDESNTFKNDEIVLSATIYDINGKEVCSTADDGADKPVTGDNGWLKNITWTVPANELYKVKDNTETNQPTLTIVAKGDFNLDVEVPQIEVTLTIDKDKFHQYYPDSELKDYKNLYAITEFTATQQGMPGTNGSKYIVKPLVDYVETYNPEVLQEVIKVNFRVNNIEYQSDIQLYRGDIEYQVTSNYSELSHIDEIIIDSTFEADQGDETTQAIFKDDTKEFGVWYKLHDSVVASYEFSLLDIISLTVKDNNDQSFTVSPAKNWAMNSYGSYVPITPATWNNSYSIQEYGFLAAAAPYIRVKPRVWDVELKQWLPEEGLSYSTQLMYTRVPEGISKVANTNEYRLTVTSVNYNTTNIIRLTVMLDGKKFTTYLPLVIGTEGTTLDIFKSCLNHPFFYVMYDSTSTVPFYRYKQDAQSLWIKSNCGYEIALNDDPAPKYLVASSGVLGIKVNDQKIFTNDGENENFALTSLTSAFYVPILFANVTSLYDFVGEWDGESAKIGEDYVISPIAAFGDKDADNRFTGLVLGAVNDSHTSYEEEFKGMIGYYQNQRTFELNATNGMAKFGRSGKGQIVIDPKQDEALIYSGNNINDFLTLTSDQVDTIYVSNSSTCQKIEIKENAQIIFKNKEDQTFILSNINQQIINAPFNNNYLGAINTTQYGEIGQGKLTIISISNINIDGQEEFNGMLINLTNPSIEWYNNAFSINEYGELNLTSIGQHSSFIHIGALDTDGDSGIYTQIDNEGISGSRAYFNSIEASDYIGQNLTIATISGIALNSAQPNYLTTVIKSNRIDLFPDNSLVFSRKELLRTGELCRSIGSNYTTLLETTTGNNYSPFVRISAHRDDNKASSSSSTYVQETINSNNTSEINCTINRADSNFSFTFNVSLSLTNNSSDPEGPITSYLSVPQFHFTSYGTFKDTSVGPETYANIELTSANPTLSVGATTSFVGIQSSNLTSTWNQKHRLICWVGPNIANRSTIWNSIINSVNAANYDTYSLKIKYTDNNQDYYVWVSPVLRSFDNNRATSTTINQFTISGTVNQTYLNYPIIVQVRKDTTDPGTSFTGGLVEFRLGDSETVTSPDQYGAVIFTDTSLGSITRAVPKAYINELHYKTSTGDVTSDRNLKNTITPLSSQYLSLIDKLTPVSYKYNDGSSGRIHTGMIAQDVEDAMTEVGLTSQDFAGLVIREMGTENQTYALRYEEFIAPIIGKIQQQDKEISDLKSEIQELKTLISQLRGQEG